jgi:tripartite-type tricarboxylate transporter receptor subunit TctC
MTFASLGVGSAIYLNAERFNLSAGFEATNVPFKGAPAAILAVIKGRVDYCFCAIGTTLQYIKTGGLIPLAVSSPNRSPLLPAVPTTLEEGFAHSDFTPWLGLFAPASTPAPVLNKLHDAVETALNSAHVREKLIKLGVDPMPMSRKEFEAYVQRDMKRKAMLISKMGQALQ